MTRITSTFRRLGKAGEKAAIPYLPIGFPDASTGRTMLPVIGRQGADLIALGITPTLSGAAEASGATLDDCLQIAAEARRTNEVPLILVAPYDAAREYGIEPLASACAAAGVDGLLIPDLPFGDLPAVITICAAVEIDAISVVSSEAVRDYLPLEQASGFVYSPGGSRPELASSAVRAVVASQTDLPLVVGMGVDSWRGAAAGNIGCDAILDIDGLSLLMSAHPEDELLLEVSDHVRALKYAASALA